MYGKDLAYTGVAGLTVAGTAITYPWLAASAAGVVILGAIAVRASYKVANRSKKVA